jgi:hypothetical protein
MYLLDPFAEQLQHRRDRMRHVMVRGKPHPVFRPAFHVLHVAAAGERNLAEVAPLVALLHHEELAGVGRGFHHHVRLAARALRADHALEVLHRGGHRHSAGTMLSTFEDPDRLFRVQRDRRHEVNCIDLWIGEDIVEAGVLSLDAEAAARPRELLGVGVGQCHPFDIGMIPINRRELGAEPYTHKRNSKLVTSPDHSGAVPDCVFRCNGLNVFSVAVNV